MPKHSSFLVIGLGTFGQQAAVALAEGGASVMAVDRLRERVERVADEVTKAICADGNDEDALTEIGAFEVDAAIVSLGDFFDVSVLVTHLLRRRGVKEVVVQVNSQRQAEAIRAVGATQVVFPERDIAQAIAERFLADPVPFERIAIGRDAGIMEIPVAKLAIGKNLRELELRNRYHLNVVAVKTPAREEGRADAISVTPPADEPLQEGQILVVLGHNHHLANFRELFPERG